MTNGTIEVAAAQRGDRDEIVRMIRDLSRHEGDPDDLFDREAAERDLFGGQPVIFGQLARVDGSVAGVALWHPAYETGYAARGGFVASLWVDPPYRRLGVATRLIGAVAVDVRRIGGSFLWWASKPGNLGAHATYASLAAKQEQVFAHALTGERFQAMVRFEEEQAKP